MKKISKIFIAVLFIFMFSCPTVYGVNQVENKTIKELELKIKKYDDIISNYDIKSKELTNELNKNKNEMMEKFNELKLEWTNEKIELEKKKNDVDNNLNCIKIVLTLIGITSVSGIVGFLLYFPKYIIKKVEDIIGNEGDTLNNIIEKHNNELELIAKKKIIVISKDVKDKEHIDEVLKIFKPKYVTVNNNINLSKYDLVIFNNAAEKNGISDEYINKVVVSNSGDKKKVYLFYGKGRCNIDDKIADNMSYANSKATLYSNLINALKYQKNILLKQ